MKIIKILVTVLMSASFGYMQGMECKAEIGEIVNNSDYDALVSISSINEIPPCNFIQPFTVKAHNRQFVNQKLICGLRSITVESTIIVEPGTGGTRGSSIRKPWENGVNAGNNEKCARTSWLIDIVKADQYHDRFVIRNISATPIAQ